MLCELLDNACKYTPQGEKIIFSALNQVDAMKISVCNWGVEIPESERSLIFEKFYRIPNNDPWKQGGTGLGLALVSQIVARLGGTIAVDSGVGQTCFILTIPLMQAGWSYGRI